MSISAFLTFLFLAGLLYLIYSFFTRILSKLDKLTVNLNKHIRTTFLILFLFLLSIIIYYDKTWNPNNKKRLEQASGIVLPNRFKVVRDEYQDMIQDYNILYDIKFDSLSSLQLVKNIKTSMFYTNHVSADKTLHDSLFFHVGKTKAAWFKSGKNYMFIKHDGPTKYLIDFDTLKRVLKYEEYVD